jgi:hypothetical protein
VSEHTVLIINGKLQVDGAEVPDPDILSYQIDTGMTVLMYKSNFPDHITIGGGGDGRQNRDGDRWAVRDGTGYYDVNSLGGGGHGYGQQPAGGPPL